MKPFLCVDLTQDKNNEKSNSEAFIASRISSGTLQSLERVSGEAADLGEKASLSKPLRILHGALGVIGGIAAMIIFRTVIREGISIADIYNNFPAIFWIAGVCLALFGGLTWFAQKKRKTVSESEENKLVSDRIEGICNLAYSELAVPLNAPDVDILSFFYKTKNGEPVPKTKKLMPTPYNNFEYKIFTENGNLYVADLECKYEIPLSCLKRIKTVNKRIGVPLWNKETHYTQGEYKEYKITDNNDTKCIYFKPYHILEFEYNNEVWGIYFPCYDLSTFEKVTGIKAE